MIRQVNPEAASVVSSLIAEQLIDGALAIRGKLVLTLKGRLLADAVVRMILP